MPKQHMWLCGKQAFFQGRAFAHRSLALIECKEKQKRLQLYETHAYLVVIIVIDVGTTHNFIK